jgi:NAD(P)-dependent dehydrogenase (short-subunit alcohol dehydrogenase family)
MSEPSAQRVALITGSARGLGRATAEALARQGVALMLVDIRAERLEATAEALRESGAVCEIFATDISKYGNCFAAVEATVQRFGRLDILINVAALMGFHHAVEVTEEEFRRIMEVNSFAPFWLIQAALPHLLAVKGNIVNVASQSALMGTSYIVPYSMSKAALVQMSKSLAVEYGEKEIRINVVAPGPMMTEIANDLSRPDDMDFAKVMRYSGLRPPSQPEAVAAVIAFISSPAASAVHGAVWSADNGSATG